MSTLHDTTPSHSPSSSDKEALSQYQKIRAARKEIFSLLHETTDWKEVKQLLEYIKQKWFKEINKDIALSTLIREQIRAKIEAHEMEYITRGQEGEIFKIALEHDGEVKEFIVIKQRYDQSHVHYEAQMFEQAAALLSKHPQSWFKVPDYYGIITTQDESHYLAMEYIRGKTLYTLQLEQILNYFCTYYPKSQSSLSKYQNASWVLDLQNDTMAEEAMVDYIKKMAYHAELNGEKTPLERECPELSRLYPLATVRLNPDTLTAMLKIIYDSMRTQHKIWLFTQQEAFALEQNLKAGLKYLHQEGFYHRDIGGNPRNLMLRKNENADWEAVLIDFGKSFYEPTFANKQEYGQGEWPYREPGLQGDLDGYIPDLHILDYIKVSKQREETEEERWIQEKNRIVTQGTPVSNYLASNFSRIKAELWLRLERLPQVEIQALSPNACLSYLETSMKEWGTQKAQYWARVYQGNSTHFALLDWDKLDKKLLVTPATERNLLQLLMQLRQEDFFVVYGTLHEQLKTAKGKRKAYLSYFLKFFELTKDAFLL